jgi:hypothetical protein
MSRLNLGFGAGTGVSDTIFGNFCSVVILKSGGEEDW